MQYFINKTVNGAFYNDTYTHKKHRKKVKTNKITLQLLWLNEITSSKVFPSTFVLKRPSYPKAGYGENNYTLLLAFSNPYSMLKVASILASFSSTSRLLWVTVLNVFASFKHFTSFFQTSIQIYAPLSLFATLNFWASFQLYVPLSSYAALDFGIQSIFIFLN